MVKDQYKSLEFKSFSKMKNWSVNLNIKHTHNSNHLMISLNDILVRSKKTEKIKDDLKYKRVTIKLYGAGAKLRDELFGSEIGTKRQYVASSGQLIISRIDARNGAFGIVPPELDGAIVTNDFLLFDVKGALIDFLFLILSSTHFKIQWKSKSSGTTNRQRVSENDFLSTEIPLPVKKLQEQLVQNYQELIKDADLEDEKAIIFEEEIEKYLFNVLGIVERKKLNDEKKYLKLYRLNELNRWDVWNKKDFYKSLKYQFVDFEKVVVGKPLYGANEKALKIKTDTRYIRITDINEDGSLGDDIVSATKVEKKYLLQENDFLIARSGNTVGKTFLYKKEIGKAIFAGYLIKFTLNTEIIIPEYLFYYTKSKVFKSWIESNKRIFGQPNINGQEYLKAQIILPSLKIQSDIVNFISLQKEKIEACKSNSKYLRKIAEVNFEEAVWSEA